MRARARMMRGTGLLTVAWLCGTAAAEVVQPAADVNAANTEVAAPSTGRTGRSARIRTGNHRGFGRVVVETTAGVAAQARRDGDRVLVTTQDPNVALAGVRPPRNVRAIQGGMGRAEIGIAADAIVRISRERQRLTIDVLDPLPTDMSGDRAAAMATNTPPAESVLPTPPIPPPPAASAAAEPTRPADTHADHTPPGAPVRTEPHDDIAAPSGLPLASSPSAWPHSSA